MVSLSNHWNGPIAREHDPRSRITNTAFLRSRPRRFPYPAGCFLCPESSRLRKIFSDFRPRIGFRLTGTSEHWSNRNGHLALRPLILQLLNSCGAGSVLGGEGFGNFSDPADSPRANLITDRPLAMRKRDVHLNAHREKFVLYPRNCAGIAKRMKTLQQFASKPETIPASTSWYLADLGEARGKQELFTKQSPQKLKVLREHALIESAVSSNRIEGVQVDQARVGTLIFGKPKLRDRDEEEVRGYRDALKLIHEQAAKLPISEQTIKKLHRLMRGDISDAGKYKEEDSDIIEKYPDGRERVRFKAVAATETSTYMKRVVGMWDRALRERWVHPVIALAAFNLDFLCIHPFRDGNGRISRSLVLLQSYHLGFG